MPVDRGIGGTRLPGRRSHATWASTGSGIRSALEARAEANQRLQQSDIQDMKTKIEKLTPREFEVFERVASGQANKVIAIELEISERTVEIHRSQVMHKTESRSLADLVRLKLLLDQSNQ